MYRLGRNITRITMGCLADIYIKQGRYEEAESMLLQALNTLKDIPGVDEEEPISTLHHLLGNVYRKQGKLEDADREYGRVYEIIERTGTTLGTEYVSPPRLGRICIRQRQFNKAQGLLY